MCPSGLENTGVPRTPLPRRWLNKGPGQRKEDIRRISSPRSSSHPEVLKVLFLGTVLQDERDVYVDLVASDLAVLYEDVHVLDPTTLHVAQRLVGSVYAFLDGFLKTIRMDGAQLGYACNSHISARPPPS